MMTKRKVIVLVNCNCDNDIEAVAESFNHILKFLIVKNFSDYTPMELYYDCGDSTVAERLGVSEKASPEEVSKAIDKLTDDEIKNILKECEYDYSIQEIL